ncbi:hypothetical protein ACFPRL_26165 [Pseudoclavibacter helvolus]
MRAQRDIGQQGPAIAAPLRCAERVGRVVAGCGADRVDRRLLPDRA